MFRWSAKHCRLWGLLWFHLCTAFPLYAVGALHLLFGHRRVFLAVDCLTYVWRGQSISSVFPLLVPQYPSCYIAEALLCLVFRQTTWLLLFSSDISGGRSLVSWCDACSMSSSHYRTKVITVCRLCTHLVLWQELNYEMLCLFFIGCINGIYFPH